MTLLPLKDYPDYCKDLNSKAILNTNVQLLAERKRIKNSEKELNSLKSEMEELKTDMSDIKSLLLQLINK